MKDPMKTVIAAAMLTALAAPAWAEGGRISCQRELGDVVRWADANQQTAARFQVHDWIEVLSAQCRYSAGLAEANLDSLRRRLEAASGQQVGYAGDAVEWASVARVAD